MMAIYRAIKLKLRSPVIRPRRSSFISRIRASTIPISRSALLGQFCFGRRFSRLTQAPQRRTRCKLYPKNPKIAQRWPREFSLEEIIDDYVDLLLLASCNYVLGSKGSSYSRVAMALNRSPLCRPLVTADVSEMNLADLAQAALHELYKLYASLRYL